MIIADTTFNEGPSLNNCHDRERENMTEQIVTEVTLYNFSNTTSESLNPASVCQI